VILGIPLLFNPPLLGSPLGAYAIAPLLRMGRFLRFIRVMRFVPNAAHIWKGVVRALQASVGVFMVLFGLNLILAMGANLLFGHSLPEYFGNPIISAYTLFKVFTVEGWYEIPDLLAENGAPSSEVWTMLEEMVRNLTQELQAFREEFQASAGTTPALDNLVQTSESIPDTSEKS